MMPPSNAPLVLTAYVEAAHYALLGELWLGHAHEPPRPEDLPGDTRPGLGVLAFSGSASGQPAHLLACGFLYETGTQLFLGPHYLLVHPRLHATEGGKALGHAALDAVVDALERYVAAGGGGAMHTFTDAPAVIARARKHGYQLRGRIPLLGKVVAPALAQALVPADGSEVKHG